MAQNTKSKMIAGAAELMSLRGVNGTSMRDVVKHTDTPRGSIAFHFPGGKMELMQEALQLADAHVSLPLQQVLAERGTVLGLRAFMDTWRHRLTSSDFAVGCPVLAAAVEPYISEKADATVEGANSMLQPLHAMASQVFCGWQDIIAQSLKRDGLTPARARKVAALVVASLEGAVALSRAAEDLRPLDDVSSELEWLLKTVLASSKSAST